MFKNVKIIDQPNIIKRGFEYTYESYFNTPNIIYVIENKTISKENLAFLTSSKDKLQQAIDYDNKNPNSPNNIFYYFNYIHGELIKRNDTLTISSYNNGYNNNNYNFAYHYFIDKKGNIYEGRPHNVRAYNLDIYTAPEILLNQGDLLFNNSLFILTEEPTDSIDTTNATYTALKSLLIYLKQRYEYKKFYCYSELNRFKHTPVNEEKDDVTIYNNPGLFFKINELHSSVEKTELHDCVEVKNTGIKIYTYGSRVLRYMKPNHMNGNDILMLQKMLYKLKLLDRYMYITGEYDLTTKEAVKSYQKKYYITPTVEYGVADKQTLKDIRERIYLEKTKNIQILEDSYKPYRVLEYIEGNPMVGRDVITIQTKLKYTIYPILEINGIFDRYTEDAVRMFQARYATYNEAIDGKVGPMTWKAILECKDLIFIADTDSVVPGGITPNTSSVSKTNIIYLQKAINELLKDYSVSIPISGSYDETTQKYIKKINSNETNRKIIGLDKYRDSNGMELDWNNDFILKTCYPAEFIWLIKHYLLKEKIELDLVSEF